MPTVTVGRNKHQIKVDDPAKALEFIKDYDLEANPRELNVLALETIFGLQERIKAGKDITLRQMAYAKALFMGVIVPTDGSDIVRTIRCVHTELEAESDEENAPKHLVRCDTKITATRRMLSVTKSKCDKHQDEETKALVAEIQANS